MNLDVDRLGMVNGDTLRRLILTGEEGYVLEPAFHTVENNQLVIQVPQISSMILKAE